MSDFTKLVHHTVMSQGFKCFNVKLVFLAHPSISFGHHPFMDAVLVRSFQKFMVNTKFQNPGWEVGRLID